MLDPRTVIGIFQVEPTAYFRARKKGSAQKKKRGNGVNLRVTEAQNEHTPNSQSWKNLSKKINYVAMYYNAKDKINTHESIPI